MIKGLHHIAIIVSQKSSLKFYEALGFKEVSSLFREERKDEIVMMEGNGITLEIFIDPTHPARVTNPEANGLRHIAHEVDDVEKTALSLSEYNPEPVKVSPISGKKITFLKDPDGQPIELHE